MKFEDLTEEQIVKICNFGPAISDDEMRKIEGMAGGNSVGIKRRLVLAACARTADVLSEMAVATPEAFKEMQEAIDAFKEHIKGLLEFADAAQIRMIIADCREDRGV
jgi:FtsZ-interacting cell division protein YlmF